MNKFEFELEKLRIGASRFHLMMELIARVTVVVGWVLAIYFIMNGLQLIVQAQAGSIHALSKLVESMQLNSILGWCASFLLGGAWLYERQGKKRAYQKISIFRKQIEANDADRSTSGLDEHGHTPK